MLTRTKFATVCLAAFTIAALAAAPAEAGTGSFAPPWDNLPPSNTPVLIQSTGTGACVVAVSEQQPVEQQDCGAATAPQWRFLHHNDGSTEIVHAATGLCLNALGGRAERLAITRCGEVGDWHYSYWQVSETESGTFVLLPYVDEWCLAAGSATSVSSFVTARCDRSDLNQHWTWKAA